MFSFSKIKSFVISSLSGPEECLNEFIDHNGNFCEHNLITVVMGDLWRNLGIDGFRIWISLSFCVFVSSFIFSYSVSLSLFSLSDLSPTLSIGLLSLTVSLDQLIGWSVFVVILSHWKVSDHDQINFKFNWVASPSSLTSEGHLHSWHNHTYWYVFHETKSQDVMVSPDQGRFHPLHWHHNGRDGVSNRLTIVYLTVYSGSDQRKHQSSVSLAFVRGIHQWPVNSPHKWPVMRKLFPFDDFIMQLSYC